MAVFNLFIDQTTDIVVDGIRVTAKGTVYGEQFVVSQVVTYGELTLGGHKLLVDVKDQTAKRVFDNLWKRFNG